MPDSHSPLPIRSPLAHADWRYVEAPDLEKVSAEDWVMVDAQRAVYWRERQANRALELLAREEAEPSFGYAVNNYRHSLESATRVLQAGFDEERVVVALLHDIGFTLAGPSHGAFSAALLKPFISETNHWLLANHQIFQGWHAFTHHARDESKLEALRGHPAFETTADFVARFDQNTITPDFEAMPLEAFRPMVYRVFGSA
jgi:predicted HD phosphohydrolase